MCDQKGHIDFNSINFTKMFGSLAAEDDDSNNLTNYFFKTTLFDELVTDEKVKIVQGYKGTGKSAMLKMAFEHFQQLNYFCLWIKPDDFPNVRKDSQDGSLDLIAVWKSDLRDLIVEKAYNNFLNEPKPSNHVFNTISSLTDMFKFNINKIGTVDYSKVKQNISHNFLANKKIYIFIDDLDRGWNGDKESIDRISSLISAVRDLSNDDEGLKFRLSLRSDMYFLLRAADSNLDKVNSNLINIKWTQNELLIVLTRRIQAYFDNHIDESTLKAKSQSDLDKYLEDIMELHFQGKGKWNNKPIHRILLSLVRERPRDLINLCISGAKQARKENHPKILTEDWENIFRPYSVERFNDTISEHKFELHGDGVSQLLNAMKTTKKEANQHINSYSYDSLYAKVKNVLEQKNITFANNKNRLSPELAMDFLYRIGFVVARKELQTGYIKRLAYVDDPDLIKQNKGYQFEIHPAFRWALNYNEDNLDDYVDEKY